ncbi:MAG: hypothetical protein ACYCW6_30000 [Candidatus Xenobia bacterium]
MRRFSQLAREQLGDAVDVRYEAVQSGPEHPRLPEIYVNEALVSRGRIPSLWDLADIVQTARRKLP